MNRKNSRIVLIHTGMFIQMSYLSHTALKLNTLLHKTVLSVYLIFIFKGKQNIHSNIHAPQFSLYRQGVKAYTREYTLRHLPDALTQTRIILN